MASCSVYHNYPSSGEYNLLVQRVKLLNLVQRVAHRDVSEMIDTVGLDSLTRKGTLSRWVWGDEEDGGNNGAAPRSTGYGRFTALRSAESQRHRELAAAAPRSSPHVGTARTNTTTTSSPPPRMSFGRSTTGFEARVAAARSNNNEVEEDREDENGSYSTVRAPKTRRRYVVRRTRRVLRSSPADRDAFFTRLAEPRERPEPVVEDVLVYDAEPSRRGGAARLSRRDSAREVARDSQRGPPYAHERDFAQQDVERRRRLAPPLPSFAADDIRAHDYGASPVYPPHSHSPVAPLAAALPRFSEALYDSGYPGARGEQRTAMAVRDDEAAAAPPLQSSLSSVALRPNAEEAEPHEKDFTPPPTRPTAAARNAAIGVVSSPPDGPVRRRSVNFALSEEDEYDSTPKGGNYVVTSLSGSGVDPLVASVPPAVGRASPQGHGVTTPAVPQLHFPHAGSGDGVAFSEVDDVAGANASLNAPGSGRDGGGGGGGVVGLMGASSSSVANSPRGLKTRSSSGVVGFPKSPRLGRGLAPKAKPKGAVEDSQVPVEAVRHAAALIVRSNSTPGSGLSPVTSTPGNSYAAGQRSSQPQTSSARTPPVGSAFSGGGGGGILLSPRPSSVNVNADHGQPQQPIDDGSLPHFAGTPAGGRDPVPATPPFLTSTGAMGSASRATASVSGDAGAAAPSPPTVAGVSAALPVNEDAQRSFQEVSSQVDHMLQSLQRVLERVCKDGDEVPASKAAATALAFRKGGKKASAVPSEEAYPSSFEEASRDGGYAEDAIEVNLDSDNIHEDSEGEGEEEEEDEMLLYTRIQHEVSRLGTEMSQFALPNSSEDGEGSEAKEAAAVTAASGADTSRSGRIPADTAASGPPRSSALQSVQSLAPRAPPRRARGEVPDAVVQRLCAYRMEHFQYIAYNERLWNTSTTSQFVFAQRLTAALLEECWAEVMAEVDANMSEYVEGLVEHELQ